MEAEALVKMEELSTLQKSHSHTESATPAKGGYPKGRTKKPKRNKSAFILFSIGMRAKLKTNEADQLNSNEMMVKLAELWKNLPKAEREAYYTEARDDKLRYLRELDNFSKNHPSESIHNRTKKNHIKKPCSAYAIFLREKKGVIKEGKPDLKMADILKIVSEQWKNLSEEERAIYKDKAQEEKETVRIKLGESIDKAKKASLMNQKKVKAQEQSCDHAVDTRESSKAQFKIGSTGDLRLKLDSTDLSNRAFDRTFSTMSTLNTMSRGREFSLWDGVAPSLSSLLSFPVSDANNNSSAKDDSELDEGGRSLLKLFDKAVQKASELLVDLFNFNLPTERFDTLNFGQRSSIQPDFNLMIPQLLNPLENLSFPSPSILKPTVRNDTANESASKAVKTVSQGNAEQKESSSPEVQVIESTSPPKET